MDELHSSGIDVIRSEVGTVVIGFDSVGHSPFCRKVASDKHHVNMNTKCLLFVCFYRINCLIQDDDR